MTSVAVRRLRLAAPPDAQLSAAQRIEDGLRLAAPSGQRVLLIRRLPLGALPLRRPAQIWTARIESALRAVAEAAVHGLSPGAERADAVWFNSIEEMLGHLLLKVGCGDVPTAWFWRAATPDWDGECSSRAVSLFADMLARTPAGVVVASRAVVALAERGHCPAIIATIDRIIRIDEPFFAPEPRRRAEMTVDAARGARALARLSPAARAGLGAALRGPVSEPSRARRLVEAALLAAAPEFIATPELRIRTAAAWLEDWEAAETAEPPGEMAGRDPPLAAPLLVAKRSQSARPTSPQSPEPAPLPRGHPPDDAPVVVRAPLPDDWGLNEEAGLPVVLLNDDVEKYANAGRERPSAVAGVLLLVAPLVRLGLPTWLAAREAFACEGFGRAVLCDIARRHGAAIDDPIWMLMRETPTAWADALTAWRIGLDRWLRRRARIRLCEVVRKRGWLTIAETGIDARFSPDAADIRLRRLALDLDPGWTPWLGFSLRYHYRAEPLS